MEDYGPMSLGEEDALIRLAQNKTLKLYFCAKKNISFVQDGKVHLFTYSLSDISSES